MSDVGRGPFSPVRQVFRTALRDVVVVTAVLTVAGAGIGALVAGERGVWGGVLGGAVALLVAGTTPVTMLLTAGATLGTAGAVALAAWVVKAGVLLVAFVALRGTELVDRPVFALVVVVGVLASLAVDYRAVAMGRVPYVDPSGGRAEPSAEQPGPATPPGGEPD